MAEKHKAAPMVDEVSDFEILEAAVRELAIEKGLFTAEDHRRFTEFAHSIGPLPAARLVAKAWLNPEFKKLALKDGVKASLEGRHRLAEPDRTSARRATTRTCASSRTRPR